jgi:chromosome segregation ATPase
MTTQHSLAEAQANLQKAEGDLKQSQIATAKEQLVAVRAEGRRVKTERDSPVRQVKKLDGAIALARGDLAAVADAIFAHHAQRPDAGDFPTDEELAAWAAELSRLESAQREQSRRVTDLMHERAYPLQQALDLDAALGRLRTQQRNLESLARGEKIGQPWEGGIFNV